MSESSPDQSESASLGATMIFPAQPRRQEVEDPSQHDPLRVEVIGGPMDGYCHTTLGAQLTIGRAAGNDLRLGRDARVSARHSQLLREEGSLWLEDLGSRNGTWLGGRRIAGRLPIGPGTEFQVGTTWLEVLPR